MTSDLETGIAEALARRACQVPDGAAARVQQAVVTARPRPVKPSASMPEPRFSANDIFQNAERAIS